MRFPGSQILGKVQSDDLVQNRGGGVDVAQKGQFSAGVAGFLTQLAERRGGVILGFAVQLACGNFGQDFGVRVAVLANATDVSVTVERQDADRTDVPHIFALRLLAVGQAHAVDVQVHDATVKNQARRDGFLAQSRKFVLLIPGLGFPPNADCV